jgi:hypothetical protein
MKKIIITILTMCLLALSACSNSKKIDGTMYETYGLFNKDEVRDKTIHYELVVGNLVWGIVLVETIVAPIYFFGFDLYEPVEKK